MEQLTYFLLKDINGIKKFNVKSNIKFNTKENYTLM